MKRSLLSFLLLFVFAGTAFAGEPIPGIGVGAGKNPGGVVAAKASTDNNGKFSLAIAESGKYDISVSYNQAQAVLKRMGKSGGKIIIVLGDGQRVEVINEQSDVITVALPASGGTISGRLTYEPKGNNNKK